jgi:NADPH-dependent glutamate synthase beta subunit-like oxidoreductase
MGKFWFGLQATSGCQAKKHEKLQSLSSGLDDPGSEEKQSARCMDCSTPDCNNCVNNIIPDFNDAGVRADWKNAIDALHSTPTTSQFTGAFAQPRVKPLVC